MEGNRFRAESSHISQECPHRPEEAGAAPPDQILLLS
ncbi:hypothetical protein LEMLEM_LOCUS10756 [Lemmus lemmus]